MCGAVHGIYLKQRKEQGSAKKDYGKEYPGCGRLPDQGQYAKKVAKKEKVSSYCIYID